MPGYSGTTFSRRNAMHFDAAFFFSALALALVLEALPWVLSPNRTREALRSLLDLPPEKLRIGGAILLALGIVAALLGICLRS